MFIVDFVGVVRGFRGPTTLLPDVAIELAIQRSELLGEVRILRNLHLQLTVGDLRYEVIDQGLVSVATPAEPRGEKIFILCKFWAVKNF